MKILTTIFFILTTLFSFGQRGANWIPFKIHLVDNKDTLSNGFDFYLTSGNKEFRPTINDSIKCFQFDNVDSLADFNIWYKSNKYKFNNIETLRLLFGSKWTVTLDSFASDTCFEIIADEAGSFFNVYFGPYPIPICDNKHYIWSTSFLPRHEGAINTNGIRKSKMSKRGKKCTPYYYTRKNKY